MLSPCYFEISSIACGTHGNTIGYNNTKFNHNSYEKSKEKNKFTFTFYGKSPD